MGKDARLDLVLVRESANLFRNAATCQTRQEIIVAALLRMEDRLRIMRNAAVTRDDARMSFINRQGLRTCHTMKRARLRDDRGARIHSRVSSLRRLRGCNKGRSLSMSSAYDGTTGTSAMVCAKQRPPEQS